MRLVGRHTGCQFGDVIVSIPRRQLVEPGVHGVELLDARRVDKAVHVAVPRLQAQLRCPQGHVVAHFFRQRLKCLILRELLAELGYARHQILAHVVVRIEENLRFHRLNRVFGHTLQGLDLVLLGIILL